MTGKYSEDFEAYQSLLEEQLAEEDDSEEERGEEEEIQEVSFDVLLRCRGFCVVYAVAFNPPVTSSVD